jgi:hypothetical protein
MVGRAKAERQKRKEAAELKETWMQRAAEIYRDRQDLLKPMSLETACGEAEAECFEKTGEVVKLSSSTLD